MTDSGKAKAVSVARSAPVRRRAVKDVTGPKITIYGQPANMEVLPLSSLNLILTTGRLEKGEEVLVPHLEFRLLKDVEGQSEPQNAFSAVLAFENAAFLIMDMSRDLVAASKQLRKVVQGELTVEPVRLAYGVQCLKRAKHEIDLCIKELEQVPAPSQKPVRKRRALAS